MQDTQVVARGLGQRKSGFGFNNHQEGLEAASLLCFAAVGIDVQFHSLDGQLL